ncbi:hypothetical protein S40288_03784 [Stachybotrys chartarum IBT 40288]|nr:hypothetical protein S40288_03784 [Stachybotrys chartarum IBT 40288]
MADRGQLKGSGTHLPKKPRAWFTPAAITCIVLRLEVLHRVNYSQQCATPGLESFLCFLFIGYEIYSSRRRWGFVVPEDADDPWRSIFDDISDWFSGPRVAMVMTALSAFILCLGTYLSVSSIATSTYICFWPLESRTGTISWQWLGVVLDAGIVVLLWRILAWKSTLKLRSWALGSISVLSATCTGLVWLCIQFYSPHRESLLGLNSLVTSEIVIDSFVLACLAMSATSWVCEASPITPAATLTFLVGIWTSIAQMKKYGDWLFLSKSAAVGPLWVITLGTIVFIHCYDLRRFLFLRRALFALTLLALTLGCTVYMLFKYPDTFAQGHPIDDLIHNARVQHDRWEKQVRTSNSPQVAAGVYQARHGGKIPPPYFAEWYKYADGAVMVDDFNQIDQDLAPFWNMSPQTLRERAVKVARLPGTATLTIRGGVVSYNEVGEGDAAQDLHDLAEVIRKFSNFLPDMILPINLSPMPRILPPWEEKHSNGKNVLDSLAPLLSSRAVGGANSSTRSNTLASGNGRGKTGLVVGDSVHASDFRQMHIDACPPGSPARVHPQWETDRFCDRCARHHTKDSLPVSWDRLLEICYQPDLKYLHGYFLADSHPKPIRQLAPLFGPFKADGFSDIIIPLPRLMGTLPDIKWQFTRRYDTLFWRGSAGDRDISSLALRGSHKFRLLHLIAHPSPRQEVTMILPLPGARESFGYEKVAASQATAMVPFALGVENSSACVGENCAMAKEAYAFRDEISEPLEYRYVLLLDEDDGPPKQLVRTLRSTSVPFVSTIFRSWYTERLVPWLHFVPIDMRYQALHTTFAYFSGTENRAKVNGRETELIGRGKNAEWIATEGQKWAEKALGQKEIEVYLFRLLLEWGRLVDDRRDEIGVRVKENGELDNDEWTR